MKTYVQIGANIGGDVFREWMGGLTEPSIIHLIEPNFNLHGQLIESYRSLISTHNVFLHRIGISTEMEEMNLSIYSHSGHSSLLNRRTHSKIGELNIICKPFNVFCEEWDIKDIELLYIDTEGLDYEILNSIDFTTVSISDIICEVWPYENDDLNCKFRTGEKFLNEVVLPKMGDYDFTRITIEGMASLCFKRKKIEA